MSKYAVSGLNLTRVHKLTAAGIAAAGAAALVFTAVPGADAGQSKAEAASASLNVKPVAFSAVDTAARAQQATIAQQADASAAQGKAEAAAAKKRAEAEAKAKAEKERRVEEAASRAAVRQAIPAAVEKPAKVYPNNLDGWIRESLDVMAKHNIPGSYNGIYRNLMRESSGNPKAINLWDSNAQAGIPSKGLLQVIDPTFRQYHVSGTSWNIYDPVANITAACNYAAARYGSMDNVNSAY
ncbi:MULTISPECIES: transglycosylase SLT domain-containing protein [Streptomyces]|uniref:transglycosylase SLT domain-containing protein n=1 Tax=Streptomyces TaxID=1883 RepID=UPI00196468E0|nr:MULTISPECIES: transglycosylase SLT domain-containing protein [Streptomyces]QRX91557.1 transglycosylase SLT domain-containing protein [Streptomyces noursei]UJB41332.1 transglycosylase SLT domain-containing protein [Streptomyces sp. A1-5]